MCCGKSSNSTPKARISSGSNKTAPLRTSNVERVVAVSKEQFLENAILVEFTYKNNMSLPVYGKNHKPVRFYGYHRRGDRFYVLPEDARDNRFIIIKEEKEKEKLAEVGVELTTVKVAESGEVLIDGNPESVLGVVITEETAPKIDLTAIKGIGDKTASKMNALGITSFEDLVDVGAEYLADHLSNMTLEKAEEIVANAKQLLGIVD